MNDLVQRLTALSKLHNSDEVMKMLAVAADQITYLEKQMQDLNHTLSMMRDQETGQVWYWQGDGQDHPESLVCPVVISANDLRALLPRATMGTRTAYDTYDQAMDDGTSDDYDRAMRGV